jgi:hypothetical protein
MEREKLIEAIQTNENGLDERESMIKSKSYGSAYMGGYFAMLIVMVLRMSFGDGFVHDVAMIFAGQITFMSYYLYKHDRNKRMNLYFSIVGLVLFLGFTYSTLRYYGIF